MKMVPTKNIESLSSERIQTWKLPPTHIQQWTRLNPQIPKEDAKDCVINVLRLFGVIESIEEATKLSKLTIKCRGTTLGQTLDLIFYAFNKSHIGFKIQHKSTKLSFQNEFPIQLISDQLGQDEYTIGLFYGSPQQGHAVVLLKHDDVFYIFDPQYEQIVVNIQEWIRSGEYTGVYFIVKDAKNRKRWLYETPIRKPRDEHTRKKTKGLRSPPDVSPPKSIGLTKKRKERPDANSYELRSLKTKGDKFPRTPTASPPEYFTQSDTLSPSNISKPQKPENSERDNMKVSPQKVSPSLPKTMKRKLNHDTKIQIRKLKPEQPTKRTKRETVNANDTNELNSDELRSLEFPRIPSTSSPEYFTRSPEVKSLPKTVKRKLNHDTTIQIRKLKPEQPTKRTKRETVNANDTNELRSPEVKSLPKTVKRKLNHDTTIQIRKPKPEQPTKRTKRE
jgi:hypothetical protein